MAHRASLLLLLVLLLPCPPELSRRALKRLAWGRVRRQRMGLMPMWAH